MILLAIDPGPEQSAYCLFDTEKNIPTSFGIETNDKIISKLYNVGKHNPVPSLYADLLIIEMIASFGMPVGASIFQTCVWIGRFIEAWGQTYSYVYRKDEKITLCNSVRAKDSNIRQALIDRFGDPGTKKNPGILYGIKKDGWSALAVAVTYCIKNGILT